MEKLRILLLGPPEIYLGDTPLQIQRKTARMLLYFLACQTEPISRAELCLLFWIDENEEDSRRHLREILSKLKSELPDPAILWVDHDLVRLDHTKVYVDAIEFNKIYIQIREVSGRINTDTPLPLPVYQKMVQAVDLWRGPRFLAGINAPKTEGFDHWLLNTSSRFESSRQIMIDRLADHSTAAGDLDAAIRWLRTAISIDEVNESAHYRLIKCLVNLGRNNQVITHCKYMRKVFEQDGIDELPPALEELCKDTLLLASPQEKKERTIWHSTPVIQSPFVGRKKSMTVLRQAYQRGGTVVIMGEAGSGKTRLVYEFHQDLDPSPRMLVAQGRSLENRLPYQPLTDMLRRSIWDEDWKKLEIIWTSQFKRLLPELNISYPELNSISQGASEENRAQLFQAILQLLTLISKNRRIIFLLEDAQWVDEATLAALAFLVERRFFRRHGLLILSVRPEEKNPALEELINCAAFAEGSITSIQMQPINIEEIGEMAHYILGDSIPDDIITLLAKETGGNPFFLVETLRALLEYSSNLDITKIKSRLPIAGSIHSLVRSRLHLLNPQAQQVAATAAIIGNEFSVSLLDIAANLPSDKVAEALDEMETYHLIQPISESSNGVEYLFPHQKMREAIVLELSPARKRVLHLRVARALENNHGNDNSKAIALAQHYESAGDFQKAFRYWQEAGKYASHMLSKTQTFEAYENAETILKKHAPDLNDQEIYQFYSGWCEMATEEFEDVEILSRAALTLQRMGEQRKNPLMVGAGLSWQVVVELIHQNGPRGLELAMQAKPFLDLSGDPFEQVNYQIVYGILLLFVNRGKEACAILEESIKLAEGSQHKRMIKAQINAQNQLALTYNLQGFPQQAFEHASRSLQKSELLFLQQQVLFSQTMINLASYYKGQFAAGRDQCKATIKKAEENSVWHWTVFNYHVLARCEIELGLLDDASEHIQKAFDLNEPHQRPDFLASCYTLWGKICEKLDDYEAAASFFQKGVEAGGGGNIQTLENYYHLGAVLVRSDRVEEGVGILQTVTEQGRAAGLATIFLPAETAYLQYRNSSLSREEIFHQYNKLIDDARERSLEPQTADILLAYGEICLLIGESTSSQEYAILALEAARKISSPWVELDSLRLLSQVESNNAINPEYKKRTTHLLSVLKGQTSAPALKPMFEKFGKSFKTNV